MKKSLLLMSLFYVAGCASMSSKQDSSPTMSAPVSVESKKPGKEKSKGTVTLEETEDIDLVGLQRVVGISRDRNDLGLVEKTFNTCEVGSGYSKVKNCRQKIFGLIHFRLQCRDSEGTTSEVVTADNLTAMSNHDLTWSTQKSKGELTTDAQGYAQIRYAVDVTQKGQRVRMGTKTDFLYLKANEMKQLIVPRYWCR